MVGLLDAGSFRGKCNFLLSLLFLNVVEQWSINRVDTSHLLWQVVLCLHMGVRSRRKTATRVGFSLGADSTSGRLVSTLPFIDCILPASGHQGPLHLPTSWAPLRGTQLCKPTFAGSYTACSSNTNVWQSGEWLASMSEW